MSPSDLRTPALLIEHMGGHTVVAEGLGVDPPVVWNWRDRDSIPAGWWVDLVALADRIGKPEVTFESLAVMHSKKPSGAAPAQEDAR